MLTTLITFQMYYYYYDLVLIIIVVLCQTSFCISSNTNSDPKQHPDTARLVRSWAQKLGSELWHFGDLFTRRSLVSDSFKSTTVVKEDGHTVLRDIHERIADTMRDKVEAIKRIMDLAEQASQRQIPIDLLEKYQFINGKQLDEFQIFNRDTSVPQLPKFGKFRAPLETEVNDDDDDTDEKQRLIPLYRNRHFYNVPVNTNYSAVHVPSNVFERSPEVIGAIYWSEELNSLFRNNYKQDPTLQWQYFASSTGFMRQYPAMAWSQQPLIDLYDARTRLWYIQAASSPKDIVILVDRSGSMTGMRREIARHVVDNILDTLGDNDYVNIYTFSNTTDALVECFDDLLVQANLANVRTLKEAMYDFKTEQVANFSLALVTAFELLDQYRNTTSLKEGANCNQAIMLITDGVQYNYKEVFETYNWQTLPYVNVRVFTYLIGREVSDVREVKWMACANNGYYVHLSTYAQVREEVLKYIPVMARPMILNGRTKPVPAWSTVYADVTDPKLTNWLWVHRQRNHQRDKLVELRRRADKGVLLSKYLQDRHFVAQDVPSVYAHSDLKTYHLMTSVSLPVYDKKQQMERVANLLGVAGTDLSIDYLQALMLPYRLGVNAYAFLVNNNGYIVYHPDLRPVYDGILKPAYNRVDMAEVEIVADDSSPREFHTDLLELRRQIVMQINGTTSLRMKIHFDEMKRLWPTTRMFYHYSGIEGTPFTVVTVVPDRYGYYNVQHAIENDIHRIRSTSNNRNSYLQFFNGNWTIHPEWYYCRRWWYYENEKQQSGFLKPEDELVYFLQRIEGPGWKWTKECDRKLISNLVADAKLTSWFSDNITTTAAKDTNGKEFIRRYGITVVFLATHSGLTRWQEFPENLPIDNDDETSSTPSSSSHFHLVHNRAIDEVWYKRAVEYSFVNRRAFIYSVPFDIGEKNGTLVTVSHAIFREDDSSGGGGRVPVAVVGYQFQHSALYAMFMSITSTCGEVACRKTCESHELHCVVLDENGYVVVSDNLQETGRFFGHIRPDILNNLVDEGIFQTYKMFDYQALCPVHIQDAVSTGLGTILITPIQQFVRIINWSMALAMVLLNTITVLGEQIITNGTHTIDMDDLVPPHPPVSPSVPEFGNIFVRKSRPEPCDTYFWVYILQMDALENPLYKNRTLDDCLRRPYTIQAVASSNLVLLVINNLCRFDDSRMTLRSVRPLKIVYNESLTCHQVLFNDLPRRHYMSCINQHANESEIKMCGIASPTTYLSSFISIYYVFLFYVIRFL